MEAAIIGIAILEGPDKYSRSKEFEGRRIDPVDGGWIILNFDKFRSRENAESQRQYNREYMQRRRAEDKKRGGCKDSTVKNNLHTVKNNLHSDSTGGVGQRAETDLKEEPPKVPSETKNEEPADWGKPDPIELIAEEIITSHPHSQKMKLTEFVRAIISKVQPNESTHAVFVEVQANHQTLRTLDVEMGGWKNGSMKYKQIPSLRDWIHKSRDEVSLQKPAAKASENWVG